jgi:hypothetical protein
MGRFETGSMILRVTMPVAYRLVRLQPKESETNRSSHPSHQDFTVKAATLD